MKKVSSCPSLKKLIKLGICAMPKKINSIHMRNILDNFQRFEEFNVIFFTEEIIFKTEIEKWPIVDALIIFYSDGFPYNKGLKYINLRQPFLINDFEMQKVFWDRVKVLKILEEAEIPIPSHIIIDGSEEINNDGESNSNSNDLNTSEEKEKKVESYKKQINKLMKKENNIILDLKRNKSISMPIRNKEKNSEVHKNNSNKLSKEENTDKSEDIKDNELIEFDDHIEYKGNKLYKPFVEKPINGDDHDIYIYYPPNLGGGHKRLFRKTKDLSSLYFPNLNEIRRDKKYLYEEFLQTDGFDIKVYTIGQDYAHAEARKSPSLDGKVNRTAEGKEVRYPINLTPKEKEIARKIVVYFKQNICGFDILRSQGNSYVCDVNGFSFVKGNKKYYEDCSILLRKMIYNGLDLHFDEGFIHFTKQKTLNIYKALKLPKIKSFFGNEELRSIVAVFRHADRSPKQKMKLVVEDENFLSLFEEFSKNNVKKKNKEEKKINEIKLKKPKELLRVLEIVNNILEKNKEKKEKIGSDNFYTKIFQIKMVLERKINFDGLTRKIQMKPLKYTELIDNNGNKIYKVTKILIILKWGGFLTHAGIDQARILGETFRVTLYPSSEDEQNGLLRLHSTYRHDLKCYSADEGRCLKTAASFLKGLLQLDGPIIPIISSMVTSDEDRNKLLDVSSDDILEFKHKIKKQMSEILNYDGNIKDKFNSMFTKESIYTEEENSDSSDNEDDKSDDEEDDNNSSFENIEKINTYIKDDKENTNVNGEGNDSCPLYELLDKIGNPLSRMKNILNLMKNVIKNIQKFLSEDTCEQDSWTYFITNKKQIEKRECDYDKKTQDNLISKILGEDKKEIKEKMNSKEEINEENTEKRILNKIQKKGFSSSEDKKMNNNIIENKKKMENIKKDSNNEIDFDCQDENIVLIYKRYVKLKNDFFNNKKNLFDISKIPDIYDNIKYDIIHNKDLMNNSAYELFDEISLLANFVMPFEYGITRDEKINIGLKIIKPLLNKIWSDLIDINSNSYSKGNKGEEDNNWSGLDATRMNDNEIKTPERHVKSRFYFTCASHMYALLNIIGYGYNSILTHKNKKSFEELKRIFDFDYCSHIIFRLFEDLNVDLQNPKRFRLEIIMSPGSNKNPRDANDEHLINISPWIFLNKNLNLEQMKQFLSKFN